MPNINVFVENNIHWKIKELMREWRCETLRETITRMADECYINFEEHKGRKEEEKDG